MKRSQSMCQPPVASWVITINATSPANGVPVSKAGFVLAVSVTTPLRPSEISKANAVENVSGCEVFSRAIAVALPLLADDVDAIKARSATVSSFFVAPSARFSAVNVTSPATGVTVLTVATVPVNGLLARN